MLTLFTKKHFIIWSYLKPFKQRTKFSIFKQLTELFYDWIFTFLTATSGRRDLSSRWESGLAGSWPPAWWPRGSRSGGRGSGEEVGRREARVKEGRSLAWPPGRRRSGRRRIRGWSFMSIGRGGGVGGRRVLTRSTAVEYGPHQHFLEAITEDITTDGYHIR